MVALGVMISHRSPALLDRDHVRRLAELLEREQCESVWSGDHPGRGRDRDDREFPSPLEWLTLVAAHSTTLVLGTAVLVLPAQHPILLAKRIATVDRLSNGRLIVGVGIGSSRSAGNGPAETSSSASLVRFRCASPSGVMRSSTCAT